jgi:hypothetical protein
MHKTFGNGRKAGLFPSWALLSILLFVPFLLFTACPTETSTKTGNEITGVSLLDGRANALEPVNFDGVHKVFDAENSEIEVTVIEQDAEILNALRLQVNVSEGAATHPTNDELKDAPIKYYESQPIVVTAENGTTKLWKVTVKKYYDPKNDITGIALEDSAGAAVTVVALDIDAEKGEAVVTVPRGTPIDTNLYLASVDVSDGATTDLAEPAEEGEANPNSLDSKGEIKVTVTAKDGTGKVWTVSVKQDPSPVQNLSVELLGNYDIRFLFAYPNYKETGYNGSTEPDYTTYPLITKNEAGKDKYSPILLSYFVDDNDLTKDGKRITYYNTLVVSAGGLETREWKIDGKMAPKHEGTTETDISGNTTNDSTTVTIHAQDWTLEDLHTVTLIGTKKDAKGNEQKYSGEFTFRVVEKFPKEAN